MIKIADHHVHVWTTAYHKLSDTQLLKRYYNLLNETELKRYNRFHRDEDRLQFLISRAMLKTILSIYHPDIANADWTFDYSEKGKPSIANALVRDPVQFNLAHTHGMIVIAISAKNDIGIDVENQTREVDYKDISSRYFSSVENQALTRLHVEQQQVRFFELWTLKESYIKATAMGLSMPLDQFDFDLKNDRQIHFSHNTTTDHQANKPWKFWQYKLDNTFIIAVSSDTTGLDKTVQIYNRTIVPLVDHQLIKVADSREN